MKAKLLLTLLAAVLCLCSCQGDSGNLGGELTVPLDRIAEALQEGNVGLYESAFPSEFVTGYRKVYGDLNETLSALLYAAQYKNRGDYGENWTLTYEVKSKESLSVDALPTSCTLDRFNDYVYTLPTQELQGAAKVTLEVSFDGGMDEEQFEITYTFLCMDGSWYLHPMHFGTVLKRS